MALIENGVLLATDEKVLLRDNEEDFITLKKTDKKLSKVLTKRCIRESSAANVNVANLRSMTIFEPPDNLETIIDSLQEEESTGMKGTSNTVMDDIELGDVELSVIQSRNDDIEREM